MKTVLHFYTKLLYVYSMIKAAIIGASGYAGQELVRILHYHPQTELVHLGSRSLDGSVFSEIIRACPDIPEYRFGSSDILSAAAKADVLFLALPHGVAAKVVDEKVLSETKVIDLGADFRLRSIEEYESWYQVDHPGGGALEEAVYGLCELYRKQISQARLVANPGCYTTCSILSLAPLVANGIADTTVPFIIDAKSGVTGAGRGTAQAFHFPECNESIKAYKPGTHRHTPEIEQELSLSAGKKIKVQFTPHLVPMNRGILVTACCRLSREIDPDELYTLFREFYKDEPFIRILHPSETPPETRWVKGSNRCDIGFHIDKRTGMLLIFGALDNLVKGAAGQAVQNMNILFGIPEQTGLTDYAIFP
jgi:N-acetyl-gamma-glutamyl-phosphate reductase